MYCHLSVDVGEDSEHDQWTVARSLQDFFQPEKLELKCKKCHSGKTATQTLEIISWSVIVFHHLMATIYLIFKLLKLIIFVNSYNSQSPKALLLHFKRFIVTQEMKAEQSSGKNSDESENKPAAPPRMEMVLHKNEVRHCMFSFIVHCTYIALHCPLIP
jgi:uncharacterized UBP type Zn finger protein